MVGEQNTPAHRYTVGALLLQAVFLLGFAALSYLESLATIDPFAFAGDRTFAVIFGVLGAIAIWLAGEHYTSYVRRSRLNLWVIICIILSLAPLTMYSSMFLVYYSLISLLGLLESLLFLILSMLVYFFSRTENVITSEIGGVE